MAKSSSEKDTKLTVAPGFFREGVENDETYKEIDSGKGEQLKQLLKEMGLVISNKTMGVILEFRKGTLVTVHEDLNLRNMKARNTAAALSKGVTARETADLLGMSERTLFREIDREDGEFEEDDK